MKSIDDAWPRIGRTLRLRKKTSSGSLMATIDRYRHSPEKTEFKGDRGMKSKADPRAASGLWLPYNLAERFR
jgi:hypothetical protein